MSDKLNQATQALRTAGIRFKSISNGKQLIIEPEGRQVSFWPSSGKFYPRSKGNPAPTSHLNGVEDLIRYIKGA
jgi:hypothetical protein